jgi:uncharacterized protein (DUF952 family)
MTNIIYKIEDAVIWARAQAIGSYTGSPLDVADGFIHLSAGDQVRETAGKWFTGREGLVLVHVDADALGDALKWEASRDGALFPHNYAPLLMDAIVAVEPMLLDGDGKHVFGLHII